ncbi:Phosphorylated carbohydrates phosphatase [Novipirellula aureliae]|uniref:Phosphorylated carbohydrates phosphatase n=1 Tax=Novipirellula aureliae TaxID=2527966 RepID=A0A5C6EA96_9BACT|nr:HAD-IA family hydrolase [Novipirellula aureliae]TWU45640.1 Phosphorylated carbohydrates phosphatase [Novipirellula aureliae]
MSNNPILPPIQGVALDMDGLLFDTERLYWQVGDEILRRRGFRFDEELQTRMMGRVGTAAMQQMIDMHKLDDSPERLLLESEDLFGALLVKDLQPMPGLAEWIDLLQRSKLPFGLATSSRRMFVDVILARSDWRGSLSFVLTGDDVVNGKPHPEMYQSAAAKMEIAPASMLVLEDSGNGCRAAVAAGAQTVAVPSEHTKTQDFGGAILIAESLRDPRLHALIK